jgi:hypothetical protein
MGKLNWAEEVFYRRLTSVVDDFGRYFADEGLLRAACYPRQLNKVSDSDIGKWLRACVDADLVRVYVAEDTESYLIVLRFGQQIRATKSKFPQPPSECLADATQLPSKPPASAPVFVSEDVSEDEGVSEPARAPQFVLPGWINPDHWKAWRAHKAHRKATPEQLQAAVDKLAKWRDAGEDYAGALENAAAGSYQGIFLPKEKPAFQASQQKTIHGLTGGLASRKD